MKRFWIAFLTSCSFVSQAAEPSIPAESSKAATQLITSATNSTFAFDRMAYLCDRFGHRFSGTTNLEMAIDWILAEMKRDGLQNVRGEEVMVPRWIRGNESLEMIQPRPQPIKMLGLGGSIGTPVEGITAELLIVKDFDDLRQRAADAKGKIVLINEPFTEYSKTVLIRSRGAIEAARVGAVASLVRSVAPYGLYTPHTGNMRYSNDVVKIPHAAITLEDAEFFQRLQNRGEKIQLRLKMGAQTLPDVPSRNIIGEIVGRERPDEIVIVSGHIDSWDLGQGAMDDAGGCVSAWEAVRLMHKLNLRPRRTVRVVLWTNEENGINGAKGYVEKHKDALSKHVLAIESDEGVFAPTGFAFNGSDAARDQVKAIGDLLKPLGAGEITGNAGGADVGKLEPFGVPIMDLIVDKSKYFWYHHTEADTVDKLTPHEMNLCTAAMAVMSYVVADLPESLPKAEATTK
jgi:carboxypeptidase Q